MSNSNMFPSSIDDVRSLESDACRIEESSDSRNSKIYASQKLAPFFEVEVSLKIFGQTIWHWVFPPKK